MSTVTITFRTQKDSLIRCLVSSQATLADACIEAFQSITKDDLEHIKLHYYNEPLDPNTKICDSLAINGITIDIDLSWLKLDDQFKDLIELRKESNLYREVKLYMCILVMNFNVATNNTGLNYGPIRLKKIADPIKGIHKDRLHLLDVCPKDMHNIPENDDTSPYRRYYKAIVEFLEACTDEYLSCNIDRIITVLQLNTTPYCCTISAKRRVLITEAKYLYAMTNLNIFFIDESDTSHRLETLGHMNDCLEHIYYLRLVRSLIALIERNRLDGIKPINGGKYHDIIFMPQDLSEYIDEDPYYLYGNGVLLGADNDKQWI